MNRDSDCIFDVPANLIESYRGKQVRVRTTDPSMLVKSLDKEDLELLISIQLEDLDCDHTPLQQLGRDVPLELMVADPVADFSSLYNFSPLVETVPVRACIPLLAGFDKAVRVAAALHFAVKLEIGQPEAAMMPELANLLDFYLHSPGVTEPIEFFHSTLMACCHDQALTLWNIQEEDPLMFRHVDSAGKESYPGRLAGCDTLPDNPAAHPECTACRFLGPCAGYFKWPDHTYTCEGVKKLFASIEIAARQLRTDIAAAEGIAP
ncbi:MAG: hypothetical protein ACWGOX_06715 [Desulforhopalus sp.]